MILGETHTIVLLLSIVRLHILSVRKQIVGMSKLSKYFNIYYYGGKILEFKLQILK